MSTAPVIFHLPTCIDAPDLPPLVARYKALRLHGLTTDPDAFSSTLARETAFTDEVWESRIRNPLNTSFIAIRKEPGNSEHENAARSDIAELSTREWVGQVTLLGPVVDSTPSGDVAGGKTDKPWEAFNAIDFQQAADAVPRIRRGSRVVYVLVGMYVRPEVRGAGYGRMLVERAMEAVKESCARGAWDAVVLAMVSRGNNGAKRLYERAGFVARDEPLDVGGHEEWVLECRYEDLRQVV
ncbi:hypothetical protein ASPCAL12935 [Aspergillus calidoustus]|uniref:N-acetyltransferase domain-containing protein n=1 Tax=Aspergillus calidoustus TaxID=454130 RepID=A0A0U5GGA3_ASPCI|nr:hypothetical protein ASPCAL12935 [Aspergillus calidoustus]